jgi:hypothetical protein
MSAQSFFTLTPIPSPIVGEGRNHSITPSPKLGRRGEGMRAIKVFANLGCSQFIIHNLIAMTRMRT